MVNLILLTVCGAALWAIATLIRDLRINIEKAKKTGLPYMLGPFIPIGYFFLFVAEILGPIGRAIPIVNRWGYLYLIDRQVSWSHPREAENKWGDTFLIVTPGMIYLKTSNAELITQFTARKTDFLKPDGYKIVDLFGRSILTQEGQEWKRHRKIVGPSFSEKSNRMVFEESLRQTEGMMGLWASQQKASKGELKVGNTAVDAATLSLHVICAAGFGVPQLWPQEGEEKLLGNGVPGFSEHEAKGSHTLTFKDSINQLLKKLMWYVLIPPSLLKISPFKVHQTAYTAYSECMAYFHELLDIKKKQMYLGESDKGTMDLLGPMIKANEESTTSSTSKTQQAPTLSTAEILGNCFIFLFAGHETTANNIHYTVLELALNPKIQRHLQEDIDNIIGPEKPISEWSYYEDMPRLYNSMVGATMSEALRIVPAICNVPKITTGDQTVTLDGRQFVIPNETFVHLNVVGINLNPRYWGEDSSVFRPERWLPKSDANGHAENGAVKENGNGHIEEKVEADGLETTSFATSTSTSLITPVKGSFLSFSDGQRACPGRRFAQVESTAVLSAIFQKHSVELDVSDFASDEEVERMGKEERRSVYEKARIRAEEMIARSEQMITLQLRAGDEVPVVFRRRGEERFLGLYE
ncbi:cytochrome P450 monooxygenase-like protein [Mollisia scopiformis]|uniref:Cytochrome P450 monooxygenase-like protein n=1 Tax=Mollisia scopiformis TaxID=149040 RepID=A0A194WYX8_MOLSC|nr:cytochrome P450 monooxygenase-like protein [Mollisia scopiformis]KUJ12797.1 cytochrome P450 monooxygenase-like protein [Mollisia scopiformis]